MFKPQCSKDKVVFDNAKILILKLITTIICAINSTIELYLIMQRY